MKKEQKARNSVCGRPEFEELFTAYVSGYATEEQREAMERHMAECEECADAVSMFLALDEIGDKVFPE